MLRVDQVHVIRHKVLVEGRSRRQVAKELGISRRTVRKYLERPISGRTETVPRRRPVWEAVGPRLEALLAHSVPLTYRPGDLAEVDFFEVLVDVEGTRRKAWFFLVRLMYSGRDFAWIYERQ